MSQLAVTVALSFFFAAPIAFASSDHLEAEMADDFVEAIEGCADFEERLTQHLEALRTKLSTDLETLRSGEEERAKAFHKEVLESKAFKDCQRGVKRACRLLQIERRISDIDLEIFHIADFRKKGREDFQALANKSLSAFQDCSEIQKNTYLTLLNKLPNPYELPVMDENLERNMRFRVPRTKFARDRECYSHKEVEQILCLVERQNAYLQARRSLCGKFSLAKNTELNRLNNGGIEYYVKHGKLPVDERVQIIKE